MTTRRIVLFGGGGLLVLAGCGSSTTTQQTAAPGRTVTTVLSADSDLTRFVTAVRRTSFDEALSGSGPYTVFAPTNSGWGSIPLSVREAALPENGPIDSVRARALVGAHIVEGRHSLSEFSGKKTTLTTVNGNRIIVDGTDTSKVTVVSDGGGYSAGGSVALWGSSTIARADIVAANGIVHVVDKAVLP